jgi:hypothetical protein
MNIFNRPSSTGLTPSERELVLQARDAARPGLYTIKTLFAAIGRTLFRPRLYGKRFKVSVLAGDLPGLRLAGSRTNGSLLYEVGTRNRCTTERLSSGEMVLMPRAGIRYPTPPQPRLQD